jgi:hypothetical protein
MPRVMRAACLSRRYQQALLLSSHLKGKQSPDPQTSLIEQIPQRAMMEQTMHSAPEFDQLPRGSQHRWTELHALPGSARR